MTKIYYIFTRFEPARSDEIIYEIANAVCSAVCSAARQWQYLEKYWQSKANTFRSF